jgi:hypothetical protein
MIAISSARRHDKNAEYALNQKRACESWKLFNQVYYFGSYEEDLRKDNVLWVKSDDWPTIKRMAEFASHIRGDLAAIINADIVVSDPILEVESKLKELTIPAATSYRYEFDPETGDLGSAVRVRENRGMDIFVCTPEVWLAISKAIPEYLRIGHPTWDTWVCGFLASNYGFGFREFTSYRCIFHPRHGGRETPHSAEIKSDQDYFTLAKKPSPLLSEVTA